MKHKYIFILVIPLLTINISSCKNKYPYSEIKEDSYTLYQNIQYGDKNNERQLCDLIVSNDIKCPNGIIYYIHGGGWSVGYKEVYRDDMINNANLGYICASINYRYMSKDSHCDNMMDDITNSMIAIKNKTTDLGLDINKALLTGASAGGHLSLLYGYAYKNIAPITPTCIVSYSGPTDLTEEKYYTGDLKDNIYSWFSKLVGYNFTSDNYSDAIPYLKQYSPINYVNSSTIPTLICHGDSDTIVPYENAVNLHNKLNEYNVKNDFITFTNSGHGLENDKEATKKSNELFYDYVNHYLL